MGIECPKCKTENTSDSEFCKNCATPIRASKELPVTKTLETPVEGLKKGATFAERYEIIEELGTGGMGKVYRVMDEKLDEEVALKVLKPEIAADKDMIKRFKNELKFARKIAHRNICKMYDLNEAEKTPYITMEYVKGQDLKNFIRRKGKLAEEDAIAIVKQVCEGLAEAHKLGVIHRDLKPQNIMIDEKRNAKVMDFGIARSIEAPGVTQTGVMIGTPDYISPEQADGEEADMRSDIYAVGIILYEMVTGGVPFRGDSALSVAIKHKTQMPLAPKKLNPEVSDDLSRLIMICIEKERKKRYQTASALLRDLTNIEKGRAIAEHLILRKRIFRSKKLLVPVLIFSIFVVTSLIIWQMNRKREANQMFQGVMDKPFVAIMYFKNNTGDESLDIWRDGLCEMLITDLSQSKHVRVLSRDRLYSILKKMDLLESDNYTSKDLRKVAAEGVISHIIQGSFIRAADRFRIDITLQKADTLEIIDSERAEGLGEEGIFSAIDELTKRIKENLNLSSDQIASDIDKEIGIVSTKFPEAYKKFIYGSRLIQIGEERKAIPFFEQAVGIDPEFAMAYFALGICCSNLGLTVQRQKYVQKVFELIDRLKDRERLQIQGTYFMHSEKTYKEAIETFDKLLQLYPWDILGNNQLAALYLRLEEWEKAIERFEVIRRYKTEAVAPYYMLARAYNCLGQHDKAKKVLEDYIAGFSDNARIRGELAMTYFYLGKYDRAITEADKANSLGIDRYVIHTKGFLLLWKGDFSNAEKEFKRLLDIDEPNVRVNSYVFLSYVYLAQGMFEKSREALKNGKEFLEKIGEKGDLPLFYLESAYLNMIQGNLEQALIDCRHAWKCASEIEPDYQNYRILALHHKGIVYVLMKSPEEAKQTAVEMKNLIEKGMNLKRIKFYYNLMGLIELEEGNHSQAIEYFAKALDLLPVEFRYPQWNYELLFLKSMAMSYFMSGDLEKAQVEFETIINLKSGRLHYGDIYAESFYILGKIFEQKGWVEKAIENYEKFLSLWKDADQGIPEVEDAKKRMTELRTR